MSVLLLLFWLCFGLFAGDVLLGRIGIGTAGVQSVLSEVGQFLLLAASAGFLTAECLRREAVRKRTAREGAEDPASQA